MMRSIWLWYLSLILVVLSRVQVVTFSVETESSTQCKSENSYMGNGMSCMSESIQQDIPNILIREAAEKERNIIRSSTLANIKAFTTTSIFLFQPRVHSINRYFHRWEDVLASSNQNNLRRNVFNPRNRHAVFVKEAEDTWRLHSNKNKGNIENMDVLSMSEFTRLYPSGFILEVTRDQVYRCFTSKIAYCKSRINYAASEYDKLRLKYINEMKQINDWETDMLKANNVKSETAGSHSESMYKRILENWEAKARPVKIAPMDKNTVKSAVVSKRGSSEENVVKKATGNDPKFPSENSRGESQQEKVTVRQESIEIAEFVRLWDKYKYNLEEILVDRHLGQLNGPFYLLCITFMVITMIFVYCLVY